MVLLHGGNNLAYLGNIRLGRKDCFVVLLHFSMKMYAKTKELGPVGEAQVRQEGLFCGSTYYKYFIKIHSFTAYVMAGTIQLIQETLGLPAHTYSYLKIPPSNFSNHFNPHFSSFLSCAQYMYLSIYDFDLRLHYAVATLHCIFTQLPTPIPT